jgi:uncharacterized membrane protein YbaN (DUF454 family)
MAPADKHPHRDDLRDQAIDAELATGRREDTVEEAEAHIMVRIGRIVAGSLLVLVGVLGLILPVLPGWILLIPGLVLLSVDVPFAARLLDRVRHRMPQDAEGNLPKSTIVASVGVCAVAASVSLWWTLIRPR